MVPTLADAQASVASVPKAMGVWKGLGSMNCWCYVRLVCAVKSPDKPWEVSVSAVVEANSL